MIPLGVDRDARTRPIATHFLVATNVLIFLFVSIGLHRGSVAAPWVMDQGTFVPAWAEVVTHPWTLVTYAFLHDPSGMAHVAFNMLFLWVFGRSVEGRLGSWWFLAFYLTGAAVAALGQWMTDPAPVIGASGAVAGVTGAFAALCPRARVKVLFLISIIDVSGLTLVIIFMAIDLLGQLSSSAGLGGRVAYSAHLGGYLFGIVTMVTLLALKIIPRTEFDLFYLCKQWHRRRTMRAALSGENSPWRKDALKGAVPETRTTDSPPKPMAPVDAKRELDEASECFGRGEFASAAARWERFASRCPAHPDADGAILLAAVTHARKLTDASKARDLAQRLLNRVPSAAPGLVEQARGLLTELGVSGSSGGGA